MACAIRAAIYAAFCAAFNAAKCWSESPTQLSTVIMAIESIQRATVQGTQRGFIDPTIDGSIICAIIATHGDLS